MIIVYQMFVDYKHQNRYGVASRVNKLLQHNSDLVKDAPLDLNNIIVIEGRLNYGDQNFPFSWVSVFNSEDSIVLPLC